MPEGPFLDLDPDPALWLVGPTPDRPTELWLDPAVDAVLADFGLQDSVPQVRELVEAILLTTATASGSPLPSFCLRWASFGEQPLPFFFGMFERDGETASAHPWLDEARAVEAPVVDEVEGFGGAQCFRSFVYSTSGETGDLAVGVRYVLDTGHPGALVLGQAASDVPGDVLSATDDLEALLRTFRVTDTVPDPAEVGGR